MGFASMGGSASASNTLSNVINFNPNMQWGENKADLTSSLDQRSSSEALNKDEMKMSASAGVAVGGGQAQGGTASLSDSTGMASDLPNVFSGKNMQSINENTPLLIGAGVLFLGGLGLIVMKKKR